MSNLGAYQIMTTLAKKVGGPVKLLALTMASGYAVGKVTETTAKAIKNRLPLNKKEPPKIYVVTSAGKDDKGLELNIGDRYRVLEADGEAILIEKINDLNNPYFVSAQFLRTISDFE